MSITDLPLVNAVLNTCSFILLLSGYVFIKKGDSATHKKFMVSATITSALFLISYIIYHNAVGSVPYPYHNWTRTLYLIILIPHIIFAALMVPFILALLRFAFLEKFDKHKRLAKFVWPVWIFVSLSGLVIYLMLYHL